MHLLHTTTKQLEEFVGPPEYAILSHRWRDEEVLFADIHQPHAIRMKGYAKIEGCCEQARRDGYQYVWIDACCIDKNSSAALAEAINSMYMWYENAQACYAYLDDVADNGDPGAESTFAKSEWFTRGWTLQELIAPKSLFFFDTHWREIGSKNSLAGLLSFITRVHPDVLTHADVEVEMDMGRRKSFSIATKMSWAAGRKTTRPEDRAYSLMGIFNVHMPIMYGEGETKAFSRLQLEIMRLSHDQSIFAWTRPYPASSWGYDTGTWPLAATPDYFAKSSSIEDVPSDEWISACRPFTTQNFIPRLDFSATNDGLDIGLPIFHINRGMSIALLSCWRRSSEGKRIFIGIRLRRSPILERYERIADHTLEDVDTSKFAGKFTFKNIHITSPIPDLSRLFAGRSRAFVVHTSAVLFIQNIGMNEHGFYMMDVENAPLCSLERRDNNIVLAMRRPGGGARSNCRVNSSWFASLTYRSPMTAEKFVVTVGVSWVQDGSPWLQVTSEKPRDESDQLKVDWTTYQLSAGRKVAVSAKKGGNASAGEKLKGDRYSVNITIYGSSCWRYTNVVHFVDG